MSLNREEVVKRFRSFLSGIEKESVKRAFLIWSLTTFKNRKCCPKQSINDIYSKFTRLIKGARYYCPKTQNKGIGGIFLEKLTGIPQTTDCLDCSDGELKLFPLKKLKNL